MKRATALRVLATLLVFIHVTTGYGQTNTTPFDLNTGNYALTDWLSTAPAGTYPTGMMFHMVANIDEGPDQVAVADYNCAYNGTSGARVNGLGTTGLAFLNTGTLVCNCSYMGSAVLALNTTNRAQVNVSFTAQTVAIGSRVYGLRLQYRLGTTGAWTNVVNSNGQPIEFRNISNVNSTLQTFSAVPLPVVCENQPVVQLRWVYYYVQGSGTGSRPQIRLDDISVTSSSVVGTATDMRIERIAPSSPSRSTAFNLTVRSTDALGAAKNVTTATTVQISLNSGTGSLSGTLTGTIPAGQNQVLFSNVVYNTVEAGVSIRATATAGQALATNTSATFTVLDQPTFATVIGAQQTGYVGVPFNPIWVKVVRADTTADVNYASIISITKISGPGNLTGTTSVAATAGWAQFANVTVDQPGAYQLQVNIPGLPSQILPFTTALTAPNMTTDIVPQFIQARASSGTCNTSGNAFPVPVFARVTFTGLQPNTTYRYNTGLSRTGDLSSVGGGFNVHYFAGSNTYSYSGNKNLTNPGDFSEFTTGAGQSSMSVWINLVTSFNPDFQEGNTIFWQVALGDALGNTIRRYQLSQTSQVIRLGNLPTQATGIADNRSQLTPKNYILLYDNVAGTGRPIATTIVQSMGASIPGAETFYASRQNTASAWATFIPNTLPNGVRRIEERDFRTNAIVYSITSANGVWNGVQTNPSDLAAYPGGPGGFATPIVLETPRITVSAPVTGDTLCAGKQATLTFLARGVNTVRIEFSTNNGLSWEWIADVPATQSPATWTVPPIEFAGQCRVRVTGIERTDISAMTQPFAVASEVSIVQQPTSANLCIGDEYNLIALTSGAVRAYQWYRNGVAIPGANSPLFRLEDVHYGTSGEYHCVAFGFGTCGSATSNIAHIRVARPTSIVNQTRNVPVQLGQKAVLTVEAELPDEAVSYQWYRGADALVDNGRIIGANASRLEINNVGSTDLSNEYRCVVVGVCGTATSRNVRVFTNGVYVEFASSSVNACAGQRVTVQGFAYVNPAGSPLNVRWWRNGRPLVEDGKYAGTTTPTLVIDNVTAADAGDYVLRAELVDNPSQADQGTIAVVIATTPVISQNPQSTDVCAGNSFSLSVTATAQGSVRYEWLKDGVLIPGENAAILTVQNATNARAGRYTVRVSTDCGSVVSQEAVVGIKDATVITEQPAATVDVQVGQPLTLNVTATGAGTLQYQWFKDGNAIAGEVAPTFTKAAAELADAGRYWVRVRSECGELLSDTSVVTTRPSTTSVDEISLGVQVGEIVPNPSRDVATLNVVLSEARTVRIAIVDVSGATVATFDQGLLPAGDHRIAIDASSIASGLYRVVTFIQGMPVSRSFSVVK